MARWRDEEFDLQPLALKQTSTALKVEVPHHRGVDPKDPRTSSTDVVVPTEPQLSLLHGSSGSWGSTGLWFLGFHRVKVPGEPQRHGSYGTSTFFFPLALHTVASYDEEVALQPLALKQLFLGLI